MRMSHLKNVSLIAELIYKEVLDWEERTKNGVIRGQSASIGQWSFFPSVAVDLSSEQRQNLFPLIANKKKLRPPPANIQIQV